MTAVEGKTIGVDPTIRYLLTIYRGDPLVKASEGLPEADCVNFLGVYCAALKHSNVISKTFFGSLSPLYEGTIGAVDFSSY